MPRHATLLLLCAFAAGCGAEDRMPAAGEPDNAGWSLYLDNDVFSFTKHDRDYTGGLSLSLAGRRVARWPLSLDRPLAAIDRGLGLDDAERNGRLRLHSLQLGLAAFTPDDIAEAAVQPDDRPYASLLYLANTRMLLAADRRSASERTLTVGLLGLHASGDLHGQLHDVIGVNRPAGWRHQISAGGEATFRYSGGMQYRLTDHPRHELKLAWEAGAGYLTEASGALSLRVGRLNTPWWSFTPDRSEYFAQPTPGLLTAPGGPRERYVWTGLKLRARLHNAFLQGQFRDSAVSYDADQLYPLLAEGWLGVTGQVGAHYRLGWVLRYQSPEIREGGGRRELLWGSLFLSRYF